MNDQETLHEEHDMHEIHHDESDQHAGHDLEHRDHEAAKDTAWLTSERSHQALLDLVADHTSVTLTKEQSLFPVFKEHVVANKETLEVGCIDERCGHQHEGYTVGLGGAGILWDEAKRGDYVKFLVDKAVEDGVSKINIDAHEGCGAAKLFLTSVAGKESPTDDEVNQAAIEFTQKLQSELAEVVKKRGLSIEVSQGYLATSDMLGSGDFHDAVGASVDLTAKFDSTRRADHQGEDLPPMFNINGTFDAEHSADNVKVALNIAFGDHGFGARFTQDRPFIISLMIDTNNEASVEKSGQVAEEIGKVVAERSEFSEGKIVVKIIDIKDALAA